MTTRSYLTGDLQVLWDSQRCVHAAACVKALPKVFNPLARPWIRLDAADTEAIVGAIERCPTGALRYVRNEGPPETPANPTVVHVVSNGPLVVRGDLHVTTEAGETRLALCRCGASENKPLCDNSHRRIGFRSAVSTSAPTASEAVVTHDGRERAESPDDLGPPQPSPFTDEASNPG